MNPLLMKMANLKQARKKINELERDYKTMGFAKPAQDPQKTYGVGTMGNIVNREFGRMTETSLAGPMGLSFTDIISNPKDALQTLVKSTEDRIDDWATANLPPELQAKASTWIANNQAKIQAVGMTEAMKLMQKYVGTDENIAKAGGATVEEFAKRAGNLATGIIADLRKGGWALMAKNHPTVAMSAYAGLGLLATSWALQKIGKGRRQRLA